MITVADLKDQTGIVGTRPILMCQECGGEYSANKADYSFYRLDTYPFFCCDLPMILIVKKTIIEEVLP